MSIKNAYSISPDDIQVGDVFLFTVKLMIGYETKDGRPVYRIYRCPFEGNEEPQGERISGMLEKHVMEALFPVVKWANGKQDPT